MTEYFFIHFIEFNKAPAPADECFELQQNGWLTIGTGEVSVDVTFVSAPNTFNSMEEAKFALSLIQKSLHYYAREDGSIREKMRG